VRKDEEKAAWQLLFLCGLPFVCGAAFNFLPLWLSVPTVLVLGIFWLGIINQIRES
jgi:hypothetical protein